MQIQYKNIQYYKFCAYGFLKNIKLFEAFFLLFLLEKGLYYTEIGVLYAFREILTILLEIPSGIAADASGRKNAMVVSFSGYIISFAVFYISDSFFILCAAMIFFSVGEAFRTGTHKAMIFEYLQLQNWTQYKVHYYGATRAAAQLGTAVSALAGGFTVFVCSEYSIIFLYSIIPYFLDMMLVLSYPNELNGHRHKRSFSTMLKKFKDIKDDLILSLSQQRQQQVMLNLSIPSGMFRAVKDYMQPLLCTSVVSISIFTKYSEIQRSAVIIACVYCVIYTLSAVSSRMSGTFSQLFSHEIHPLNITLILSVIFLVSVSLFYMNKFLYIAVFLYISLFIIENLRKPIGISFINSITHKHISASILSAESLFRTLSAAFFSIVLGITADTYGLATALLTVSLIMIIIIPGIYIRRKGC